MTSHQNKSGVGDFRLEPFQLPTMQWLQIIINDDGWFILVINISFIKDDAQNKWCNEIGRFIFVLCRIASKKEWGCIRVLSRALPRYHFHHQHQVCLLHLFVCYIYLFVLLEYLSVFTWSAVLSLTSISLSPSILVFLLHLFVCYIYLFVLMEYLFVFLRVLSWALPRYHLHHQYQVCLLL